MNFVSMHAAFLILTLASFLRNATLHDEFLFYSESCYEITTADVGAHSCLPLPPGSVAVLHEMRRKKRMSFNLGPLHGSKIFCHRVILALKTFSQEDSIQASCQARTGLSYAIQRGRGVK